MGGENHAVPAADGILKATEGHLHIAGRDAFADRVEAKRLIGFLPDEPVFYSYLSGQETLELSAAMHCRDIGATMERMTPVISQLRLTEHLGTFAEDYSRGMKKKLGLVLALLHRPKLLVLDEPTNGLDVESTHLFYDLVLDEAKRGTTILFSTHLMDHVARLCSRAVIINDGSLVADGPLEALRATHGGASLERDKPVFSTSTVPNGNLDDLTYIADADYDAVIIEMEHEGF